MELFVVGLVAAAGFASYSAWFHLREPERKRALEPADRTLSTLRVNDLVEHLDRDYVVEEVVEIALMHACLYRLVDGDVEHFLFARESEADPLWLDTVEDRAVGSEAPQTLELGERVFQRIASYRAATLFSRSRYGEVRRSRVPVTEYATDEGGHALAFSGRGFHMTLVGERRPADAFMLYPGV